MAEGDQGPSTARSSAMRGASSSDGPPSSGRLQAALDASDGPPVSMMPRTRRHVEVLHSEPSPGAPPGTLVVPDNVTCAVTRIHLIDYDPSRFVEKDLASIEECVPFLTDNLPSITWVDVRGLCDKPLLERMGQIFRIHPLALEDVVNAPQRPKTDVYQDYQLIIGRMVQLDEKGRLCTEQLGLLFGRDFVLTVQEDPDRDVLEPVRERIRKGRGTMRTLGADYLAYAILDAVIDGFYPVLETFGERIEDLEVEAAEAPPGMSRRITDVKRSLLTVRRAIWPQRDLLNSMLRDESPHIRKETRLFLRDTYDHAVQVMDMVETFREIASGLMDLYLSGVSNRMNEIMKVLTVISTIFLPLTFIAGVYGMNFDTEVSRLNMPELKWRYGYPFSLGLMALSVVGLLVFYRRRGWIGRGRERREREHERRAREQDG